MAARDVKLPTGHQEDAEIRVERDFMEHCRAKLTRMRGEVTAMLDSGAAEGDAVTDKYFNHALREFRKQVVKDLSGFDDVPLFFGRLDYPAGDVFDIKADSVRGGDSHTRTEDSDLVYVGRRGVRDEDGEPIVIDWRAMLSRAFYEASSGDSMGVRVRRRYGFDQNGVLTAYEDEPLTGEVRSGDGGGLLAAEIERPRQGPMRDIVATIQPEQMRLVRAAVDQTLCIQGAPGTGKTAVGLHRLAYLLFAERDRLRKEGGVAVIGPNSSFLAYIRNVLPALGEIEVSQVTIDDLTGAGRTVGRVDDPAAAHIKGGLEMAEVLRRHLWSQITRPTEPLELKHQHRTWRVSVEEQADELEDVLSRRTGYGAGRELLVQRLAHRVLRQMERVGRAGTTLTQLCRNRAIGQAVRGMWPAIDPARLVFDLLTDPDRLAAAADGVLSPEHQRTILLSPRPRSVKAMIWSTLDLALLDEAAGLVDRPVRLGHIVIDEAQDLSPMHFRAISRRVAGACTVLGDLAQATSPSAVRDWSEVLAHLGRPGGRIEVLDRGYRVPAEVLDYAARLLPHIAPDLTGPTSFRHSADALHVTRTSADRRTETLVEACETALSREGSVCLIAADEEIPELHAILTAEGITHTVLGGDVLEAERVTLAPVTLAKGLEYDTVLVVEPSRIVDAEPRGLQRLYVALTRAVSRLHVVHAQPLPAALDGERVLAEIH
ncbi:HelD family protein [Amycolatopsis keratiniphila]|uniref:HelD family protein n=1 Tax=Amycolatopsis keratiniphila TaxID=129921 RepID=UPI00087C42EB|nr:ATP-binding domain-containing protein [Amycolatopsis keratiniphila]SDU27235.1 DNA helicase IV [Amycolatopsis keratiniphila]